MELELVLTGLRDIHLPPPVSFWPPQPMWWLLALAPGMWWWYRVLKRRRKRVRISAIALAQLNQIRKAYRQHQSCAMTCAELSRLMRRVALARFERRTVAHLTGSAWLEFLNRTGNTTMFTQDAGRWLGSAPYMQQPEVDVVVSFRLIRRWIKQQDRRRGGR